MTVKEFLAFAEEKRTKPVWETQTADMRKQWAWIIEDALASQWSLMQVSARKWAVVRSAFSGGASGNDLIGYKTSEFLKGFEKVDYVTAAEKLLSLRREERAERAQKEEAQRPQEEPPKAPEPRAMDEEGYAGTVAGQQLYRYKCAECGEEILRPYMGAHGPMCYHGVENDPEYQKACAMFGVT